MWTFEREMRYNRGVGKSGFPATSAGGGTPNAGLTINKELACMTARIHCIYPILIRQAKGGVQ